MLARLPLYLAIWFLEIAVLESIMPCKESQILVLFSIDEDTSSFVEGLLNVSDFLNVSLEDLSQRKIKGTDNIIFSLKTEIINMDFLNLWGPYKDDIYLSWSVLINLDMILKECQVTIVGPSRSDYAKSIAGFIFHNNLTLRHLHISPLPISMINEEVRGSFEGLVPTTDLLSDACIALLRHAEWTHILTISQDNDIDLVHTFMRFQRKLKDLDKIARDDSGELDNTCGIITDRTLGSSILVSPDGHIHVNALLSFPVRVVFLFLNPILTRRVLCQLKNYRGTPYQFVIIATSFENILSLQDDSSECTREEMTQVLVEAIAVGYNNTRENVKNIYKNGILAARRSIFEIEPLSIVQRIDRQTDYLLAHYFSNHSLIEAYETTFVSSEFPKVYRFVDTIWFCLSLFSILVLTAATVLTHVLTIQHWNSKSIRAMGIKMQQLSFVAIYELIVALFIYSINKSFNLGAVRAYFCVIYSVVSNTAVSLLLSALAMHHWRLYRIFNHYLKPGDMLSNRSVILMSTTLGIFPIFLCVIWIAIERPFDFESSCNINTNIFIREVTVICMYKYYYVFLSLFIGYISILILATFGLHWITKRRIPKSQINFRHSNAIFMLYSFVFIYALGYAMTLIAYFIRNIWLEFFSAVVTHVLLIAMFLTFLFMYPLYFAIKESMTVNQ